ncbi:MAG: hypothetical protein HQL34_03125 [Alphaproteobacteria bacterium]|nr:hypothetical protein [Alphaproteobacteria bacterium]
MDAHAAHAVASLGELGIALSVTILADIPRWRERASAHINGDVFARENAIIATRNAGWIYAWPILCVDYIITKGKFIFWYVLPALFGLLGYLSIMSMACGRDDVGFVPVNMSCLMGAALSFWVSIFYTMLVSVTLVFWPRRDVRTEEIVQTHIVNTNTNMGSDGIL